MRILIRSLFFLFVPQLLGRHYYVNYLVNIHRQWERQVPRYLENDRNIPAQFQCVVTVDLRNGQVQPKAGQQLPPFQGFCARTWLIQASTHVTGPGLK